MKEWFDFDEFKENIRDKSKIDKHELIVIIVILAIIIVIGIIIGSIISGTNKNEQGIVMVSYDGNGATGRMDATECKKGSNCILKNNEFIKDGYNFIGWGISENEESITYKINDTYNATEDTTLYALWEIKKITITYDANGGTGTMEPTTYTYGESIIPLPENAYEKKGYTFNSWQIYNPTIDKWYGCTEEETECNDSKESTTLGWHDREEVTTYYSNIVEWNTKTSEYDMIYYAQWGESTYEIKYELNGGISGKDAPTSGVFGSTVTVSNPTRKGFMFTGWKVEGTDATLKETELTIGTSDITLTAQWKEIVTNNNQTTVTPPKTTKIAYYIQNLYNDSSLRNKNSLNKDDTSDANIRYVGNNPYNYVMFNNELWRIIGIFNINNGSTTSKRVKLVREDTLLDASWDSSSSSINNGRGINEWSQADIKTMLNDYYAGNSNSCNYCNGTSQSSCSNNCKNKVAKLEASAKNMIENAVWYLGSLPYDEDSGDHVNTVLDAYNKERGSRTGKECSSNKNCTDSVTRTSKWTGMVGLIYISDYGYASTNSSCRSNISYNNNCQYNNWLSTGRTSYWTITPRDSTSFANAAWYVSSNNLVDTTLYHSHGIRPTIYLKDSVVITGGDGTSSNPYKLGI